MKKVLIGLAALTTALVALLWVLYSHLDALAEAAVEDLGSQLTGSAVTVERVAVQVSAGRTVITGLAVASPPGYDNPVILHLEQVSASVEISSLFQRPIVIEELDVREPLLFLEMDSNRQFNLSALKKNIEARAGPAAGTPDDKPLKFVIRKLVFEGGTLSFADAPGVDSPVTTNLPAFQMENLGKARGGATVPQLAGDILDRLIHETSFATGRAGFDALKEKAREKLESAFGGVLKGILRK
jgi:hypothetical protein